MTNEIGEPDRLAELREQAKARLEREEVNIPDLSAEEVRRLVHDLRTHQIELEMQNEELRLAQQELIESRDRFSDLYDFAPVGYVTVSHKGLILEANLALAEMLSIERIRLINQPFSAFIVPDDQDIFYRHRRNLLDSKQRDTCRLRIVGPDAEPIWIEVDSIPIETDDENNSRLRMVISDVTERKQAEAEKQAFEQQLQHAQKLESLGVLAGGIAHDFNNLLMTILGNADLAMHKLSSMSPVRQFLREIEKASRRAAELANQMLSYSGKGEFVVEEIDIRELVDEMGHMLEVSISKKVALKYHFADRPAILVGDVTQIRQVVMNLITNASEAMGDMNGVVTLSTGTMTCDRGYLDGVDGVLRAGLAEPLPEGDYAYVEVADTGCGMDPEIIEKIFDPFFTTKFKGRGLGMSAVLGIVRGHKGAIRIDSTVGTGTTFTVLFPAIQPREETGTAHRQNDRVHKNWRGGGTVLLVDDDETVRGVGKAMLSRLGFTVLTAPNGREALKLFDIVADNLVFVLLDLTMPDMDGEETFREMRRLQPDVKVILCSGYKAQNVTERFANTGLAGFIQKPFDLEALKTIIMQTLRA